VKIQALNVVGNPIPSVGNAERKSKYQHRGQKMECESCGCKKMDVLESRKQWLCPECGSIWTYG